MLCHRGAGSVAWAWRLRGNAGRCWRWRAIPTDGARLLRLRQELWQVVGQWVWNLRLVLGRLLEQDASRSTLMGAGDDCCQHRGSSPSGGSRSRVRSAGVGREPGTRKRRVEAQTRSPCGKMGSFNARLANCCGIRRRERYHPRSSGSSTSRRTRDGAQCSLRTSYTRQSASGKRGRRVSARRRRIPLLTTSSCALGAEAIRWNDVAGRRLRRTWMSRLSEPSRHDRASVPGRSTSPLSPASRACSSAAEWGRAMETECTRPFAAGNDPSGWRPTTAGAHQALE